MKTRTRGRTGHHVDRDHSNTSTPGNRRLPQPLTERPEATR
ncbi:hypothetical protein AB0I84_22085 [Streptomyces spectabilis]